MPLHWFSELVFCQEIYGGARIQSCVTPMCLHLHTCCGRIADSGKGWAVTALVGGRVNGGTTQLVSSLRLVYVNRYCAHTAVVSATCLFFVAAGSYSGPVALLGKQNIVLARGMPFLAYQVLGVP